MHSVIAFAVFGVDWEFFKPYIVLGLALGGAYALSGVGIVVLYQATGVLNLAFGAIGAAGALICYWILNHTSWPGAVAYASCIAFGAVCTFVYGVVLGPAFARRDPLVKMMGTLALALILLGFMAWRAPAGGAFNRVLTLPTSKHRFELFGAVVNWTQVLTLVVRDRAHGRARRSSSGTRSSARPIGRSPPTARSPPRSGCPCAASRRRRGSARGSSAARPGCCSPTSTRRSTTRH